MSWINFEESSDISLAIQKKKTSCADFNQRSKIV